MNYAQCIALFTKEDEQVTTYFAKYKDEISAVTDTRLAVIVGYAVWQGNADEIVQIFDDPRYKDLRRDDLPCLWFEADKESGSAGFAVHLPANHEEITKTIRILSELVKRCDSLTQLRAAMEAKLATKNPITWRDNWALVLGSLFALAFFVELSVLVFGSADLLAGKRMVFDILCAFSLAASFGFIGGKAKAAGQVPWQTGSPIKFGVYGGFAVFIITFLFLKAVG